MPPAVAVGVARGELGDILRAERPLLNLLQRASGIATMTRAFVDSVQGTRCRILHTRKTAPGLRSLDIAAVLAGGGHRPPGRSQPRRSWSRTITGARSPETAPAWIRPWRRPGSGGSPPSTWRSSQSSRSSWPAPQEQPGCWWTIRSPETVRAWGRLARERSPRIEIEATGGISLANVRDYAEAGADFISIGALTHSVTGG